MRIAAPFRRQQAVLIRQRIPHQGAHAVHELALLPQRVQRLLTLFQRDLLRARIRHHQRQLEDGPIEEDPVRGLGEADLAGHEVREAVLISRLGDGQLGVTDEAPRGDGVADLPDPDAQGDQEHVLHRVQRHALLDDDRRETTRDEDWEKFSKPVVHPMVRTHPVHGSRAVYFHAGKTVNIEGMGQDETRDYLNYLLDSMMKPEIVYTHKWRKGDLFIFDDRATMHRAHGDYDRSQSRVLWRIIVVGDEPRLV